jgi:hypothetical protein
MTDQEIQRKLSLKIAFYQGWDSVTKHPVPTEISQSLDQNQYWSESEAFAEGVRIARRWAQES